MPARAGRRALGKPHQECPAPGGGRAMSKFMSFACRLAIVLAVALRAGAQAQEPPPMAAPPPERSVGGHVGIATPLVTVTSDDTTNIGDDFVIANPVGVSVKISERLVIDFEMIVQNPVDPRGESSLVIDPGVVYGAGPVALGLRVASVIGAPANVGVIPLVNKGLVDLGGGATWFVEAAFPTFLRSDPDPDLTLDVVLHTGIGF
ncbi:hypothetical protein Anae109_2858 [Anaeromyxobacter sp. Fw109-5]|nr:hypothetical protein Anae109_2858 [Anaeromyxobacter sp. Fw109-5]